MAVELKIKIPVSKCDMTIPICPLLAVLDDNQIAQLGVSGWGAQSEGLDLIHEALRRVLYPFGAINNGKAAALAEYIKSEGGDEDEYYALYEHLCVLSAISRKICMIVDYTITADDDRVLSWLYDNRYEAWLGVIDARGSIDNMSIDKN